ncbi:MAG TPA: hypothetical protein VLS89_01310, partial [Candidatus Nanopelagicales bacterium]|nr:hypothetical protein [Candidatus Nanopelagicales bacterium]
MALPDRFGPPPDVDVAVVIARAEAAAGASIWATPGGGPGDIPAERVAGPKDAIRAAVARALAGGRASALIGPDEILDALPALREAAAQRAPILVHAAPRRGGASLGRDEIATSLDVGAGVLVTWSAQDAADVTLSARRAAEDSETPFLHIHDGPPAAGPGFGAATTIPDAALAARFLGGERERERPAR